MSDFSEILKVIRKLEDVIIFEIESSQNQILTLQESCDRLGRENLTLQKEIRKITDAKNFNLKGTKNER